MGQLKIVHVSDYDLWGMKLHYSPAMYLAGFLCVHEGWFNLHVISGALTGEVNVFCLQKTEVVSFEYC